MAKPKPIVPKSEVTPAKTVALAALDVLRTMYAYAGRDVTARGEVGRPDLPDGVHEWRTGSIGT